MKKEPVSLLILENNPNDAELAVRQLEREGFTVKWTRVETEKAFREALKKNPDLILADYIVPSFIGIDALKIKEKVAPEIPLIMISGKISEAIAVECTRLGAADYVLKDRLFRLGTVVKRVLGEARAYRERRQAEQALQKRTYDLGERVMELRCLYNISNLVQRHDLFLKEILEGTVNLILPAWQYPEVTCARIILEDQTFKTDNFEQTTWKQTSEIVVHGEKTGTVEVFYLEERPKSDEGPFLKEERRLIDAIAERLGRVIEQKKAEEALREREVRYRTLVENIPGKIFLKDKNSVYIFCNNNYARDLKIEPHEITGREDYEFYPKQLAEKYRRDDKRIVESGKTEDLEERYIQDGQERCVHTIKAPIRDEKGTMVGILGIFRDITERKKAEDEARESQKAIETID